MSFPRLRPLTSALTLAAMLTITGNAQAQLFGGRLFGGNRGGCSECAANSQQPISQAVSFSTPPVAYNGGCSSCGPAQPVAHNVCAPVQQISYNPCNVCTQQQVVYRQVPVTEYKQVTQTVRKPIVETAYEDRQFTEYETVYETKTAQIPTVSYQNVSECQTVTRDMGRWCSYQTPNCKVSPCQYDRRPGLLGMLNRTGYSLRSAFTPAYTTQRRYVPNVVTAQVPVTRQVAVRGTQQVSYQVARVIPKTVTKQVAVRKVRWEEQQVVASLPTTTYRTVPIGTQTAYGFVPFDGNGSGTTTALAPTSDPISSRTAEAPKSSPTPVPTRTAEGINKNDPEPPKTDGSPSPKPFSPFGTSGANPKSNETISQAVYVQTAAKYPSPASPAKPTVPSSIRPSGWRARTTLSENSSLSSGTALAGPSLQVANATN